MLLCFFFHLQFFVFAHFELAWEGRALHFRYSGIWHYGARHWDFMWRYIFFLLFFFATSPSIQEVAKVFIINKPVMCGWLCEGIQLVRLLTICREWEHGLARRVFSNLQRELMECLSTLDEHSLGVHQHSMSTCRVLINTRRAECSSQRATRLTFDFGKCRGPKTNIPKP